MRYLLDTNILSDVIKNPQGQATNRITTLNSNDLFTSIIVAAEMRYGIEKKSSPILTARVDSLLQTLTILPLDIGVDRHYGQIRMHLERQGNMIGANDLLIAAHALSLDAILVTHNVREFERVNGLKTEDWLS